jgi:hypothetical protein
MEAESLMPESHSKIILWYRCYALSSKLLGMALGYDGLRWLTSNWTTLRALNLSITYLGHWSLTWLFVLKTFFRHLLASSLLIGCAYSRLWTFTEKRHALPRSDCLEEEFHCFTGSLPTGHIWVSSTLPLLGVRWTRRLTEVTMKMTGQQYLTT